MIPNSLDFSRIRHDLRTPINQILGYCEMLLEDPETPATFQRDLERMCEGGRQLLELIKEYFNEAAFEAKRGNLHQLCHDLHTPVNDIVGYSEMLQEQAEETGQNQLVPDLQKIHGAAITWLALMEEYLMQPQSEVLSYAWESPEAIPRITSSILQSGFLFQPPTQHRTSDKSMDQGHLLVVDDDATNRDMLTRRLQRQGYVVSTAESGRQALQILRSKPLDLVLLDLIMPGIDGYQVLIKIKNDPALQHIPVIMISGLDQQGGIARCIEAGAEDYLTKPFSAIFLRARIGACLANKRMADQLRKYTEWLFGKSLFTQAVAAPRLLDLHRRERTILFADIRGFTRWSENHSPEETVAMLNQYFENAERVWADSAVIKTEYTGDEIMGIFPTACEAARIAHKLRIELRRLLESFGLGVGMGIHTGLVTEGIMGGAAVKAYRFVGDTVNSAHRLCQHAQADQVLLSEATWSQLDSRATAGPPFELSVKGKAEPMKVRVLQLIDD
jgi:adenylate cyclase